MLNLKTKSFHLKNLVISTLRKFHHLNFCHLVGFSNLMIGLHFYEPVHSRVINVLIKISYSVKELYSPGITNLTLLNPVLLAFLLRIPP